MGYGRDLSWQQDSYLAISMSASLTGAAPLCCSSMLLALLCISAKIKFFLGKVYKWKNHFHEMNGDVGMAQWK